MIENSLLHQHHIPDYHVAAQLHAGQVEPAGQAAAVEGYRVGAGRYAAVNKRCYTLTGYVVHVYAHIGILRQGVFDLGSGKNQCN